MRSGEILLSDISLFRAVLLIPHDDSVGCGGALILGSIVLRVSNCANDVCVCDGSELSFFVSDVVVSAEASVWHLGGWYACDR